MNFIIFVLSKFRTILLAVNHLIIQERSKFDTKQKSMRFLLEIMTLVPSANNTGSETEFILRGRPFIYSMNNTGPINDPWGKCRQQFSSLLPCWLNSTCTNYNATTNTIQIHKKKH